MNIGDIGSTICSTEGMFTLCMLKILKEISDCREGSVVLIIAGLDIFHHLR